MERKNVCITNCDTWLGCSVAMAFLCEKMHDYKIICAARDPTKCEKLKKEGAEIHKIDYDDKKSIEHVFKNCHGLVLIPEREERMVEWFRNTCDVLSNHKQIRTLMISCIGSESDKTYLKMLGESEGELTKKVDNWTIVRKSFLQQGFLLWAPIIQEKGEFPMSLGRDHEFSPLDLHNLCEALISLCKEHHDPEHGDKHRHKKYNLTGLHKRTGPDMVGELREVIGKDIKFKEVERRELENYLRSICKRPADAPNIGDHKFCPNEIEIGMFMDYFDYVKEGKADFTSGDFKRLTGKEPNTLRKFFERHSDDFQRGGGRVL